MRLRAAIVLVSVGLPSAASGQNQSPQLATPELIQELNAKTRIVVGDTLYVFYRRDATDAAGIPIDTAFYSFFDTQYPELRQFRQPGEIFGVSRLTHGSSHVGYMLRVPSQYAASAIDLWVLDRQTSQFLSPIRIADKFGDGAWFFTLDGWLVDLDGDGIRDLVQRRRDWWLDDVTDKAQQSDSLFVTQWQGASFGSRQVSADPALRGAFDIPDWDPDR